MLRLILVIATLILFLATLVGGGAAMRRRKINMEGVPPINRNLFRLSKLAMIVPWGSMVLQCAGVNLSPLKAPRALEWISIALWIFGFGLMFAGGIGLGNSFRVGCAKEKTLLVTSGVFRYSRNPIYLGMYATFLAATLYTLNPLVLIVGAVLAVVHHRIILAEEECLRKLIGQEYEDYCRRVGRYL